MPQLWAEFRGKQTRKLGEGEEKCQAMRTNGKANEMEGRLKRTKKERKRD
jgi:hypothetical protein